MASRSRPDIRLDGGDDDVAADTPEGSESGIVLVDATPSMRVCTSEIFGPVCSFVRVRDFAEALTIANGTEYGLQASVFTTSIKAALQAVETLDFGSVLINEAPEYRVDQMPYGGTKASGNTKEGPAHAILELTEEKLVVLGG